MAIPEINQIRIIPDMMSYGIENDVPFGSVGSGFTISNEEFALDHRASSRMTTNTKTISTGSMKVLGNSFSATNAMLYLGGHNLSSANGMVSIYKDVSNVHEEIKLDTPLPLNTVTWSSQDGWLYPSSNDDLIIESTYSDGGLKNFMGIGLENDDDNDWDSTYSFHAGIIHLGGIYKLPTRANASLKYNTKSFNKVQTSVGGQSYSTLYNTNSQRVLDRTWDYIDWSNAEAYTSDTEEFSQMIKYTYGSHIPVLIQLSDTATLTLDHFMFARITKWNQTQISPTLWKISATFEELV